MLKFPKGARASVLEVVKLQFRCRKAMVPFWWLTGCQYQCDCPPKKKNGVVMGTATTGDKAPRSTNSC